MDDSQGQVNLDREELAWAAGFFDGEGSVGSYPRGHKGAPRIMVQVAQVDREVLDRFAAVIGEGVIRGPLENNGSNSSPYYAFSIDGHHRVQHAMCLMWNWLGSVKKEAFIKAANTYLNYVHGNNCQANQRSGHEHHGSL